MKGLMIDWDTADRITLSNLKDSLEDLEQAVKHFENNTRWVHRNDYVAATQLIPMFKEVIEYYQF